MRERINQLVINEGMTAAQFAEKVGISPASLSHILNGRNEPTLKVLMKIHEVCGVSLEWLAYGTGEMMEKAKAEESSENEASLFAEIPLFSSITPENLEKMMSMDNTILIKKMNQRYILKYLKQQIIIWEIKNSIKNILSQL